MASEILVQRVRRGLGSNHFLISLRRLLYSNLFLFLPLMLEKDCQIILDVGSGEGAMLDVWKQLRFKSIVALDIHLPSLLKARAHMRKEDESVLSSSLHMPFVPKSFDCVLCFDMIEHLAKKDGWRLLDAMETISKKQVVIFTPSGHLPQTADDNPFQRHQSYWTAEEFQKRGYVARGFLGLRGLRGGKYAVQGSTVFGRLLKYFVARTSEFLLFFAPSSSSAILCVKKLA